jgi:hypothetical protein
MPEWKRRLRTDVVLVVVALLQPVMQHHRLPLLLRLESEFFYVVAEMPAFCWQIVQICNLLYHLSML